MNKKEDRLKIIFAGTPEIALPTLQALIKSTHKICGVYTQPDRPAGRGQKLTASPVKEFAIQHHLPVYQPQTLKNSEEQEKMREIHPDVMVVLAYGLILPKEVLQIPRYGCINIHVSLLPRWRGAAPIQRAILAGDKKTGVTIMQMDEGLDTGNILKQESCEIFPQETSQMLQNRLSHLGAELLLKVLEEIEQQKLTAIQQDKSLATYAKKIEKAEAQIDWNKSALEIARAVYAFNPWPITFSIYENQNIRIWQAIPLENQATEKCEVGTIIDIQKEGIDVMTGQGILRILELQLPSGKRLAVKDFLNAKPTFFKKGAYFVNYFRS